MAETNDPIVIGEAKKGDNSRLMLMVGAGVALLFVVLVLPKILGGGGESTPPEVFGATVTTTTTQPATSTGPSGGAGSSKNPFVPLVASGSSASAPAGMDATNTSVVNPTVAVTPTTPGTTTNGSTPPGTGTGPAVTTYSGTWVGLIEVLDDASVVVQVDDDVYQAAVDETFANSFRVSSTNTSTRCATFVYGDQRVALCEGDAAIL